MWTEKPLATTHRAKDGLIVGSCQDIYNGGTSKRRATPMLSAALICNLCRAARHPRKNISLVTTFGKTASELGPGATWPRRSRALYLLTGSERYREGPRGRSYFRISSVWTFCCSPLNQPTNKILAIPSGFRFKLEWKIRDGDSDGQTPRLHISSSVSK